MGRWSQYDEDNYRLPEGMTRIGYDADTQQYTYRDASGRMYEGAPGSRYGVLQPAGQWPYICGPPKPSISSRIQGPYQHENKINRRLSDFLDDSYFSEPDEKSNFRVCGECLVTPFAFLFQTIASWVPTKSSTRESDEGDLLLGEKTSHISSRTSSRNSSRTSSQSDRSQTTRDYLLNGANPKGALRWFDEKKSQFRK